MYDLIVKLIITIALLQLGITVSSFKKCHSRECIRMIETKSRDVLKIQWQPISVFPDEAKRFRN